MQPQLEETEHDHVADYLARRRPVPSGQQPVTGEVYKRFLAKHPVSGRLGRGVANPDGSAHVQWCDVAKFRGQEAATEFATEAEWQAYFVRWDDSAGYPAEFGPAIEAEIKAGRR
jgi:hypothetical protein